MKNQLIWQDSYNLGVESLDRDHQRLFGIINKLFTIREEEKNIQWACQEGIKFLKTHALRHFEDEEAYMASIGYKGLERHRQIHRGFRENTLPALEQELEQTGYSLNAVDHFLSVCTGWLVGHTLTEDQAITGGRASQWEDLLPDEELGVMKKTVSQLMFDMFQLEAKVVSEAYAGEKFGKGVYYHLVYSKQGDERKSEVLLALEEKLLLNTVGKIMGLESNRLDTMLIHAARYMARQFVGCVMEHMPGVSGGTLTEENLLSYEQFQKIFMRVKPQASLLFNTGGKGYFSCCIIAPHLLESGVGTPIEAGNALTEVEKYLLERTRQMELADQKKKILVVDDSLTVRQSMKNLLDADYQVSLAESGIAAIRAITLDRPDVILLDHEMPVCDGSQTLAMLRSDPSFADIPVIFLSGRSDPELVARLVASKPAGYLLKHLKPEELKKKIDDFLAAQNT